MPGTIHISSLTESRNFNCLKHSPRKFNTVCQTVNEILRGNTRGVSARETRELAVSSRVSGRKNLTKVCTMPTINPVSFE